MFKNRKFRFSPEVTVTVVLAAMLCYSMSYWQFTRYEEKKVYEKQVADQKALGQTEFTPQEDWSGELHGLRRVRGVFDYENEMALINRSKEHLSGVKVVTPLKIEGLEQRLLVDRGFLPFEHYSEKNHKPWQPKGVQELEGILRPSKTASFFLSTPAAAPMQPEGRVENYFRLEIETMAETLPYPVFPVFLEQTNQEGPYPVFDPKEVVGPGRHMNYTIQWASFGSFALFLGWFLQFRPRRKRVENKVIDRGSK